MGDLKASETRTKANERGAYFERNKEITARWIWKLNTALSNRIRGCTMEKMEQMIYVY